MYASVQKHDLPSAGLVRFCGRAGGAIIFTGWMLMVVIEFVRTGAPVVMNYYQGLFLGVIFVGYAVGWRHELVGASLAIVGTLGFIALNLAFVGMVPLSGSEWFAAPGVFYFVAHYLDETHNKQLSS